MAEKDFHIREKYNFRHTPKVSMILEFWIPFVIRSKPSFVREQLLAVGSSSETVFELLPVVRI